MMELGTKLGSLIKRLFTYDEIKWNSDENSSVLHFI